MTISEMNELLGIVKTLATIIGNISATFESSLKIWCDDAETLKILHESLNETRELTYSEIGKFYRIVDGCCKNK